MTWTFNRNYKDLGQVAAFYPAYLAVYEELAAAGKYPYNDEFRGRVAGIEGPAEDSAIYLLQTTRHVREHQARLAAYRADGWRDLDPAEVAAEPVRFAGVVDHSYDMSGTGWSEWSNARVARWHSSLMVLPGRARVNGALASGSLLVKDA